MLCTYSSQTKKPTKNRRLNLDVFLVREIEINIVAGSQDISLSFISSGLQA